MDRQEFLSKEKKKELEKELQFLKTKKRSEILDRLAFAKSLGDLSENAEYHSSKDDQGKNEARISQIETILKDAVVVKTNTDGTIGLGSIIGLKNINTKTEREFQIVGNEEADLDAGKMSFESPIGLAVMNKKEGDIVLVETPKGKMQYEIKSVN